MGSLVPHQLSPGRPRRWRWLRRRPRRRDSPGPPARRTNLACRTLPVMAVIPVPVVSLAPARVSLITRAPVIVGRRSRRRLGDAAGQSESEQDQSTTRQHACAQPNPRSRSRRCTHTSIVSREDRIPKTFSDSNSSQSAQGKPHPSPDACLRRRSRLIERSSRRRLSNRRR